MIKVPFIQRFRIPILVMGGAAVFVLFLSFLVPEEGRSGLFFGYLLGLLAVTSHLVNSSTLSRVGDHHFFRLFYLTMVIRFALVLILFSVFILLTKIDEIFFTLTFIISYLFHSVIDAVIVNKTYSTDSNKSP